MIAATLRRQFRLPPLLPDALFRRRCRRALISRAAIEPRRRLSPATPPLMPDVDAAFFDAAATRRRRRACCCR